MALSYSGSAGTFFSRRSAACTNPCVVLGLSQEVLCEVIVEALGKHWSSSESMGLEMNQPLVTALG